MRAPILVAAIGALLFAAVGTARAQVVTRTPPDTTRRDSTLVDSLHPRRDTISTTERLLNVSKDQRIQLQPLPSVGLDDVRPRGGRIVFSRDSIDWAAAETLSELLNRVPGVYIWRGGGFGSPELVDYQGQGSASVEYYIDGVPHRAIGTDSLAFDPSTFSLAMLSRVEVEPAPGLLRVYMYTLSHDRQAPKTKIGFAAGDRGIARYFASFERRYPSGVNLAFAGDYFGINVPAGASGAANMTNGMAQIGYAPSTHFGVQAQMMIQSINRDSLINEATNDTLSLSFYGKRTDEQLRFSWHRRLDGLGPRVDLFAAHSVWKSDTVTRNLNTYGGVAAFRRPTWSAQLTSWFASTWTPRDTRLSLGWAPTSFLSGSVESVTQTHDGDRSSAWATARLGLQLPLGFHVSGVMRDGRRVQNPSLADDVAQSFTNREISGGVNWRPLTLEGGLSHTDAWMPIGFQEFYAVPTIGPVPSIDWINVHARLTPRNWLTLETYFTHPRNVLPEGTPPDHAISTATIRSKFLRNFPSGIFDLKLQMAVESWSPGVIGEDRTGAPIALPGGTFIRGIIQMQIGPLIAYYDRANMRASKVGSVTGYALPSLMGTFGIRWEFSN